MLRFILPLILVFSVTVKAVEETEQTASTPAQQVLPESDIPLNLEKNKKAVTEEHGAFRIIFTLSILGLLGTGAFFLIRKYKVPQAARHQTQIKILQQQFLGPKKSLAIIRVAGESILIGVTDHNISMIKSLSLLDDEVPEEALQNFEKVFGGVNEKSTVAAAQKDLEDEFAISGVKDIVSKRLKGMRSFQ